MIVCYCQETLWKKLQRSLGLEKHSASSPSWSHSSQPDLHQTPMTRRFLLETSSPLTDDRRTSAGAMAPVSTSASTFDGWRSSRDPQLTMTSRCRSLPGRMHDSGAAAGQSVDGWDRASVSYRQARGRRTDRSEASATSSVPLRTRRTAPAHHHHHQQQQHGGGGAVGVNSRHSSSPTYVTASSHLTLPAHRSRAVPGTTVMAAAKAYGVPSQHGVGRAGAASASSQARHVSPSHFSWPGASFDLQAGGLADDEEGRSSGGTQGAAEPTSPSLPSSTSTATNACTRPPPPRSDVTTTNDDVTPSNGGDDADTEIADVTAAAAAAESADNADVIATPGASGDEMKASEDDDLDPQQQMRRRRSCEFNLLDDDDFWPPEERRDTEEWAWSGSESGHVCVTRSRDGGWAWSTTIDRSDWTDVMGVNDDTSQISAAVPCDTADATTTTGTTAAVVAADGDDDDDDDDVGDRDVTALRQTAINETVMKCIESCDKVLLRHSTAIR